MSIRECSKIGCRREAAATLTYDYRASLAAIGPLSGTPVAGAHDLCAEHAARLIAPVGWQVIRHTDLPAS